MIEALPARERQLFEALYALGEASAAELGAALDDGPGNSAIRVMLSRLEKKGFVTHRVENARFIFAPAIAQRKIKQSAAQRFVETYFKGSAVSAAAALIGSAETVSPEELETLERMIAKVRQESRA